MARVATSYLSKELNTEVKINKLNIRAMQSVRLYGFLVRDHHLDTLLYAHSLNIKFRNLYYLKGTFEISTLSLDQADFRLTRYEEDEVSNLTLLIDHFTRKDSSQVKKQPLQINLAALNISNSHFRFNDQQEIPDFSGVDFKHTEIFNLNFRGRDLQFKDDTLTVRIDHINLLEKSGFQLDSLSCDFTIGPDVLQAHALKIITPRNNLDLDLLFTFESFQDYKDFVNLVKIKTEIRPSEINLSEVGYFAPVMYTMDNRLKVVGNINGTVSNFKAKEFKFAFGETTQFRGEVQMNGLPTIEETYSHLSISYLRTSAKDVREFRLPASSGEIDLPQIMDRFGIIDIQGKFTGFYNDFVSYANFKSQLGVINTDLLLRMNEYNKVEYEGKLACNHFNVGRLLSIEDRIQRLDLMADVVGKGIDFETMKIEMVGSIDSLEFFDNVYNEILLNGELDQKRFTGYVGVEDELGTLDFSGTLDYRDQIPTYNFTARIEDAYLDQINFISRDTSARLSTTLTINFLGDEIDNMQGIIVLDSTTYREGDTDIFMDDFTLSITRDSTKYGIIRLYSDLVDANMEGKFKLQELPDNTNLILNAYLDTLVSGIDTMMLHLQDQDFYFNIDLKNTKPLTQLFIPELEIAPGTSIYGGYNSRINNLFFDGKSAEIIYDGIKFINWYSEFYISDAHIQFMTGTESIHLSDTLRVDSINVLLKAQNNNVHYDISWRDKLNQSFSEGDLTGNFKFLGKNKFRFNFDQANISFADTLWQIQPSNYILIDSSEIKFRDIILKSMGQEVGIIGKISQDPADTLYVHFKKFNLSNFDLLLQNAGVDLDGIINGNLKVIDYYQTPFYLSNLELNGFRFNKENLGNANIISAWNPQEKAFNINADFIYTGNIGQRKILGVNGKYYPRHKTENFDIDIELDNYRIKTLEPFTRSFSSDLKGYATGKLKLRGTTTHPDLSGEIDVNHASMLIDFVNVRYSFSDRLHFDQNRFYWTDMTVYDSIGNTAIISGSLSHERLKDFFIDMDVKTDNILGLNTTRGMNSAFYGTALASGGINIHGPVDNLSMDIYAKSQRGTNIKIPVSYGAEVINNDYIVFVDNDAKQIEEEKKTPVYETDIKGMSLDLEMDITNEADIQMFMPYQMGNIRTRGSGSIIINISPTSEMTMDGQYIIDRGSFFLTLQNIINRDFDIRRGGRVLWTGDPYDARINLTAVYKVKTKLGDYGPQEDSATRVPVDCIISLSNRLLDPEIRFSIEFPDLKDDTKQYIYSRLDTTDQAMMSQQMISLLVLNSFYQGSGYSGSVGFNTYSLLTNQLNNWLSSISNDFDIGVNYRPGDDISAREVEVALSTQLWDDRVLIDGNLGVRETNNTQNTNNIVGEVTVEVKITPDGKLRAKAFNKSNDNLLYKNYAPYTQGVGIFYEFNKLTLRNLFGSGNGKEDKEQNAVPPEQTMNEPRPNSN
ncbi:MAG: translocation/assembly module TamB [Bacteroidetes bacterium]|nr:translocation/assembly module TamB [Bacteroidota bacterium]